MSSASQRALLRDLWSRVTRFSAAGGSLRDPAPLLPFESPAGAVKGGAFDLEKTYKIIF